ncbi:hypothetical protein AM1_D0145 (plasmid) [Acaryochloris marina MBIC11017]|uniref:Uncharacterized protein n=1 Tax=Acaryochloris marina (strain MBIC 11017) TaxID=329726 RepID=A8ZNQ4_ACAM1|nr:hypothetical protein AM1_D0145 [Acaryochloris marina MBIC11017]
MLKDVAASIKGGHIPSTTGGVDNDTDRKAIQFKTGKR